MAEDWSFTFFKIIFYNFWDAHSQFFLVHKMYFQYNITMLRCQTHVHSVTVNIFTTEGLMIFTLSVGSSIWYSLLLPIPMQPAITPWKTLANSLLWLRSGHWIFPYRPCTTAIKTCTKPSCYDDFPLSQHRQKKQSVKVVMFSRFVNSFGPCPIITQLWSQNLLLYILQNQISCQWTITDRNISLVCLYLFACHLSWAVGTWNIG